MKKKISGSLFKEVENVTNFSEILKIISEKFPENIFLVEKNVKINFYQFNALVNKCCNYFLKKNIKKKDEITINLSNSIEFIILYFAIIRYGAIINPIPYGTSNEKLKSFLKLSKSKIFITRKGSSNRNITNQELLLLALKGWETVTLNNLPIKEQIKTFAEATHILSPHSAGLINL